jgi:hypothetical protein
VFSELVVEHYIERAPLIGGAMAGGYAGTAPKRRSGAPRPGTAAAAAAEAEAAARHATAARAALERFRLPTRLQCAPLLSLTSHSMFVTLGKQPWPFPHLTPWE